jgi:hypothetical protein
MTATASPAATAERIDAVRDARAAELPRLAVVLARSYATCPAWRFYLPPESKRRDERMERFFGALLRTLYADGGERRCLTTAAGDGAALWDPPNGWKMSGGENAHMFRAMLRTFRAGLPRAARWFSALESGHPTEAHYYLSALGVAPGAGRQAAEGLVAPVLEQCDSEGMPAYLETGRPQSRELFASCGFEVTEELELPAGGPLAWRMWREPRS